MQRQILVGVFLLALNAGAQGVDLPEDSQLRPRLDSPSSNPDNPPIPNASSEEREGEDPDLSHQWGLLDIGAPAAWKVSRGSPEIIVAVIDSGIDYTHEDLLPNLWRNPKEIPDNGIDDDKNGYVDDVIGWDFVSNDNKPYDLTLSPEQRAAEGGGNSGHGTHCAGTIAARGQNSLGISGVAPRVKIMALRFMDERGLSKSEYAIKAIRYAVDNGAKILSNSWGTGGGKQGSKDGEEGASEMQALKDAITYAQERGVLFVASAGNGDQGMGFDNDTHPEPGYPASFEHENIISVTAIGPFDNLWGAANWGLNSVDIAAPGMNIYSTMVGNKYGDKLGYQINGSERTWDGTSMAAPYVAGAAALYWSAYPHKSWQEVKQAILVTAKQIVIMMGMSVSGGKLDLEALMNYH